MDSETLTRLLVQEGALQEEEARADILETGVIGAQFVKWTMEDISAFCKSREEKVTAFLPKVNGQAPQQKETTAPSAGNADLPLGGSNGSSSTPSTKDPELDTLKIPQLAGKMKEEGTSDEAVEKLVHEEIDGKAFLALKESDLVVVVVATLFAHKRKRGNGEDEKARQETQEGECSSYRNEEGRPWRRGRG